MLLFEPDLNVKWLVIFIIGESSHQRIHGHNYFARSCAHIVNEVCKMILTCVVVSVWRQSAVIRRVPVVRAIRARKKVMLVSAVSMAAASASPTSRVQVRVTVSTDSTASTAAWNAAAWRRSDPGARPSTN